MIKTSNAKEKSTKSAGLGWTFDCPTYDNRSSNSINAGTHLGKGKTQPVGKFIAGQKCAVPYGRMKTLSDDQRDEDGKDTYDIVPKKMTK